MRRKEMNSTRTAVAAKDRRASEKGAALIMTLLVSTLLLIAGGALILTTSMAAGTAIDSTSEMQAYYSAESGVNAALSVLRRNLQATDGVTGATFRNAVNDPTLSNWLTYSGTMNGTAVVPLNSSPAMGYTVAISDPDNTAGGTEPSRLLVSVVGYGPKGSSKQMDIIVKRLMFEFTPIATILLRGNSNNLSMSGFNIGDSEAKEYNGYDNANPAVSLPVFGVTHAVDLAHATAVIDASKPATLSGISKVSQFDTAGLPDFVQTADKARAFLNDMQAAAASAGRYFTSSPTDMGSNALPKFTFVDGDADLVEGAGLLIVTGNLTVSGNISYNGVILVLGQGSWDRSGGGNGGTFGAIVIAKFDRNGTGDFLTPNYNMDGGGASTTRYDSEEVNRSLDAIGLSSQAVREH
jgi:hypothetical protein